jgi:two-component system NtrC family sensor kinase
MTARRLAIAFTAVLLLFGMALVVTLVALAEIGKAESEVARLDHAKHAGHHAAALVRDQYIHQAHTLIELDDSHLGHYRDAVRATSAAVKHLQAVATDPEERRLAAAIASLAAENDHDFQALVVPSILRGERHTVAELNDRLERIVDQVVTVNEQLNARLEARSDAARRRADTLRGQVGVTTWLCFGIAIVLAAIVGVWLTRSILGPVGALRAGVKRVAEGDLATRIQVRGKDEFAELATAFNHMAANVTEHQAALVRTQKLASIGQVAAGVAHEINNPLGVILGYTKLLRRQALTPAVLEDLRVIEDEAGQCQRIVKELLDLARPQTLELAPVDLGELAREELSRLDDARRIQGRTLRVEGDGALAIGDAGKLRQVIANLIINAAQATGPGGRVSVESGREGGDALLRVVDDGPGMTDEVRARMFDPFFTTKPDGTGLGLAIAHAIVDAHGGRLEVRTAPGEGTRVTLRLPGAPEARP